MEKASFVDKKENGCWIWTGPKDKKGYGLTTWKGRTVRAHRLLYELQNGFIGEKLALHKCDIPSCVNPDHIFLGTAKENYEDSATKNRNSKGSKHGMSKLNEGKVKAIKVLLSVKMGRNEIAQKFDVSRSTINYIAQGKAWRHV